MSNLPLRFQIVIYRSEDGEGGAFTAHCLNMDIIADDDSVEGAASKLLENIEATINAAVKHNAAVFSDAPMRYWKMLGEAQPLAPELWERIIRDANKRLGHHPTVVDDVKDWDLRQLGVA